MNTLSQTRMTDDGLGKAIWASIAFHVAFFIVFAVRAVFYPSEPLVLQDVIRVDMVALPDKTRPLPPMPAPEAPPAPPQPEQPKPVDKPAEKPVEKPVAKPVPTTPTVNLKKAKREQDSALKRIAAMEKLERMMKEQKAQPAAKPAPPTVVKGNESSHGSALKGIARLENQGYVQSVDDAIKAHWNLPSWLAKGNFTARARVYIDANGNILKRVLTVSSRNQIYDERVLAAIDASAPLPRPPASLIGAVSVDGIELEFVPE